MSAREECRMDLLVSDGQGVYIPHEFAKRFGFPENFLNWEEVKENILYLQDKGSVNHEDYWDRWQEMLDAARLTSTKYPEAVLMQDGDLWLVDIKDVDLFDAF